MLSDKETIKTDGDKWLASRFGRLNREERVPDIHEQNVG
jgi:hypothetical protein